MGAKGGSNKVEVTDYRMSIHMGVASQVDRIRSVWINEKQVWSGAATAVTQVRVDQPYLFGGPQKEGGVEGTLWLMPGKGDQITPGPLATRLGRTYEDCPGFRGLSSVFFTGFDAGQGWKWSTNSPLIAQTVWMDVTRISKGLDPSLAEIFNSDAPDAPDTNGAHIIFEVMTDQVRGMGADPADFDLLSFNDCAQIFFDEKFGLSIKWMQEATIEDFVNEILDHVQAMLYLDQETGLWTLKALRDDYNLADLPVINPDNAVLSSFERRYWGEATNQITVSYTNPANEKTEPVTVFNQAVAEIQGAIIPDSRNYYAIRNKELATKVAWRDLATVSAPLANLQASVDRSAYKWHPGGLAIVTWPSKGLDNVVCRIMDVDYGKPDDYDIGLTLTEDIFSLRKVRGTTIPGSEWVDPSEDPTPMTATKIFTLPAYMTMSADFEGSPTIEYPEVFAGVLGYHPSYDVGGFVLGAAEVNAAGDMVFGQSGIKSLTERALLQGSIPPEAQTVALFSAVNIARGPKVGGFVIFGDGDEATQEIALLTAFDGVSWTLKRGVMDTAPRAWPAGTSSWFVNPGAQFVDEKTVRSAGETVTYKLLTRTSKGQLSPDVAPAVSATLTDRPYLPLRPANLKVNGVPFNGAVNVSAADEIVLTWATRNRLLEDGQAVAWDAAPVSPEYLQRTVILVTDVAGNEIRRYVHLWTENTFTIPKAWFARYTNVRIYVFAEREGLNSLQVYRHDVSGLPGDAGAAEPPLAPDQGVPPPPSLPVEDGAFTVEGGVITSADTPAKTPALIVSGRRRNRDAVALSIRYAVVAQELLEWIYHPPYTLDERDISFPIIVAASTRYRVDAAYISGDNITSIYKPLSEVTSGSSTSEDSWGLAGRPAQELIDQLENAEALSAAAAAAVAALEDEFDQLGDIAALAEQVASDAADAEAAAALAEGKASDANASAVAASGSAGAADTSAQASAANAQVADSRATEAEQFAAAADVSKTAAATSASDANTSAGQASQSAEDAQGSSAQASQSATNAANSSNDAGGSASAAAGSASAAQTHATDAGNSASAADASRVAAESARDGAGVSATAASTSASNASTSATDAGLSATAASGSATRAETDAGYAQSYMNQASASAAGANTSAISAGVSATSAREAANTALATAPGSAIDAFSMNQWSTLNATANLRQSIADSGGKIYAENGALRIANIDAGVHIHTAKAVARPAGRRFKIAASYKRVVGSAGDGSHTTLYYWAWNAAGTEIQTGEVWAEHHTPAQGLIRREVDVTFDSAVAWVRTMLRVYSPTGLTEIQTVETIDAEGQIAAASSASAASSSAASAAGSAASASASTNLAVTASQGGGLPNSRFLQWPVGDARPTYWDDWSFANGEPYIQRRDDGLSAQNANNRRIMRHIYDPSVMTTGDMGCSIRYDGITPGGTYNFEVEVAIQYGGPTGSGFDLAGSLIQWFDSPTATSDLPGAVVMHFRNQPTIGGDIPGVGAGDGRIYRFNITAKAPPAARLARIYAMTRWVGFGAAAAPNEYKILNWYRVDLTPASDSERAVPGLSASLSVTSAVAADAQTRLSSARFTVLAAAGSDPAQLQVAADGSGSLIGLVASAISFSNVVNGVIVPVMRLINGSVFITGVLTVGTPGGGRIVIDGPNMRIDIYDEANRLKMRIGKLN